MKLLNYKQLIKFWNILNKKDFYISQLYDNRSERDVFVKRVSRLLKTGLIILNRKEETPWLVDGIPCKTKLSNIHLFCSISHISTWKGSKIRLNFIDVRCSHIDLDYNDLLELQYKYLSKDEEELYYNYMKLLNSPLEQENVVYIPKGVEEKKLKSILKEYNLLGKVNLLYLRCNVKYNSIYITLGNTGRYIQYSFQYDNNDMFNILNKEDYEERKDCTV